MKKLLIALCLTLAAGSSFAKDEKAATPQQSKMGDCNKEAKEKSMKGDDRKAFMKSCLSTKGAAAEEKKELTPQQQKMQTCNKEAKEKAMKGPDRKKFMSECLKSDKKAAETKK
jgi:hypothetical protein